MDTVRQINNLPLEIADKIFYMGAEHPCAKMFKKARNQPFLYEYSDLKGCIANCNTYFGIKRRTIMPKSYDLDDMVKLLSFVYLSDEYRQYAIKLTDPNQYIFEIYYKRLKVNHNDFVNFKSIEELQKHMHDLADYKNKNG